MTKSAKGKEVNMQALMLANQFAPALGNAKMNARGDILGKNGKIVKTREQIAQEYNQTPPNKVVTVPLAKDVIEQVTAQEAKEQASMQEIIIANKKSKTKE